MTLASRRDQDREQGTGHLRADQGGRGAESERSLQGRAEGTSCQETITGGPERVQGPQQGPGRGLAGQGQDGGENDH